MKVLGFRETKKLCLKYKIPLCQTAIVETKKEAADFARKIGYPVVLKISSPDILHKTDVGGIKIGIKSEKELRKAFSEILNNVKKGKPEAPKESKLPTGQARIEGILVQEQVLGKEAVVGMKRDLTFGPVLMFGLGGIFVEVLKDVAFRVVPINKREALKMIKEIKGYEILKGFRGEKPVNIKKIAEIITFLSKLSLAEKNIKEIDLNPIIVNEKRALVVDARFLL